MQFDLILLFISTLHKLMLWYVNKVSFGVFSFSFKKLLIWVQYGCTLGHSQNKCILDSDVVLQKSHKLDSIIPYLIVFHYLAQYALNICTENCEVLYQ